MQQGTAPQNPTQVPRVLTRVGTRSVIGLWRDVSKGVEWSGKHTHGSIPAVRPGVFALALQCLRVRGLQVLTTRRLHVDESLVGAGCAGGEFCSV